MTGKRYDAPPFRQGYNKAHLVICTQSPRIKRSRSHQLAEWCNARLIVVGERSEVLRFARLARKKPAGPLMYLPDIIVSQGAVRRLPRPQAKPDAIFKPDMWVGEGGDLSEERMEALSSG